ncbi:MAG: glycosyltransferase family protein [Candidatus Dojkabacteria bacterium]|nr:glycosyltransferase family protein [Candidatus Dojkabacteria bacterium]
MDIKNYFKEEVSNNILFTDYLKANQKYIKNENINKYIQNEINFISSFSFTNYKFVIFLKNIDKIENLKTASDVIRKFNILNDVDFFYFYNKNLEDQYTFNDIVFKNDKIENLINKENFFLILIDFNKIFSNFVKIVKKYFFVNCFKNLKILDLEDTTENYIKNKFISLKKYNDKKNVFFTLVILVNNKEIYLNELKSLQNQLFSENIEIISLLNFDNHFTNCSQPLNYGINLSSGKYILICHQDLLFPNFMWLEKIKYFIVCKLKRINWGVLGIAGILNENNFLKPIIYLHDQKNLNSKSQKYYDFYEVDTLDELCLIIKNNNILYFDENIIDHFHFYGVDICLEAKRRKMKNFAINAECIHLSDGTSNFLHNNHYEKFKECAIKVHKKWISLFPKFATTVCIFEKEKIHFTIIDIINSLHNKNLFDSEVKLDKLL